MTFEELTQIVNNINDDCTTNKHMAAFITGYDIANHVMLVSFAGTEHILKQMLLNAVEEEEAFKNAILDVALHIATKALEEKTKLDSQPISLN